MPISLHVRHEVTPDRTLAVLQGLNVGEDVEHITQWERQLTRLRQLGLVEQNEISPLGENALTIVQRIPDLWGEIGHFLHYSLWDSDKGKELGFSWTYQKFTDAAWSLGSFELAAGLRETITSSLINLAEDEPDIDLTTFRKQAASISKDSLNGVLHWLAALVPPVINQNTLFERRTFCPPELLLLAVGHMARQTEGELGIDLLLTPPRREAVCRLCLLEPAALDRALNWMLPLYPTIVVPGTTAGTYGRFLRFLRWPTLADVAAR